MNIINILIRLGFQCNLQGFVERAYSIKLSASLKPLRTKHCYNIFAEQGVQISNIPNITDRYHQRNMCHQQNDKEGEETLPCTKNPNKCAKIC